MMNIPKMRTIPQIVAEYKAADPNTSINPNFIRSLIKKGKIPFLLCGHRYLINADILANYLSMGEIIEQKPQEESKYGGIRRIKA